MTLCWRPQPLFCQHLIPSDSAQSSTVFCFLKVTPFRGQLVEGVFVQKQPWSLRTRHLINILVGERTIKSKLEFSLSIQLQGHFRTLALLRSGKCCRIKCLVANQKKQIGEEKAAGAFRCGVTCFRCSVKFEKLTGKVLY